MEYLFLWSLKGHSVREEAVERLARFALVQVVFEQQEKRAPLLDLLARMNGRQWFFVQKWVFDSLREPVQHGQVYPNIQEWPWVVPRVSPGGHT